MLMEKIFFFDFFQTAYLTFFLTNNFTFVHDFDLMSIYRSPSYVD